MAMTEKQKAALDAGRKKFTSETAKAAQLKSCEKKLTMKYFREQAMKEFDKNGRSQRAFERFAVQAEGGDVASIEVIRKWIGEDPDEKANNDVKIELVISGNEEKNALNKWAKKK